MRRRVESQAEFVKARTHKNIITHDKASLYSITSRNPRLVFYSLFIVKHSECSKNSVRNIYTG